MSAQPNNWQDLPAGAWFFCDSPSCTDRYSVQERTSGGCSIVCGTPYTHEGAKRDMLEIVRLHEEATRASVSPPQPAEENLRPIHECRRALAETVEQTLRYAFTGKPDSRSDTWEKRVQVIESALNSYENRIRAATVSLPQAPAEAPAATEGPTQELLQDALLLASAVCNQADDGIDRGAFILTRAIQVRKALRDRFRLDENGVCIDCGHDACDCPPVATEGPGAQTVKELTLEIDREEDGRWIAEWTQSPGSFAYGNSEYDAIRKATDLLVPPAVPGAGSAAPTKRAAGASLPQVPATAQEVLCGSAKNADTSMNQATRHTAMDVLPSEVHHLPEEEWRHLSKDSRDKLATWFRLATERLQLILDQPEPEQIAEHIGYKIQSLLADKYTNSLKIVVGIIAQELRAAGVSLPAAPADDPNRCAVCGWTLAAKMEEGCMRGNCSLRPLPWRLYAPMRAQAEYGGRLDMSRFESGAAGVSLPAAPQQEKT